MTTQTCFRNFSGCLFVLAVLAVGSGSVASAAEQDHAHAHAPDDGALTLNLDNGARWPTDEALRTGMDAIHAAFRTYHHQYKSDGLEQEDAAALADQVEQQVQQIIATCKLPANADAELHKLLGAIMVAVGTLRESSVPHDGLHALHSALKAYGRHFDHPDWQKGERSEQPE